MDDKTPVVEYKMELTNEKIGTAPPVESPEKNAPKTGDRNDALLLVVLMGVSAVGAGVLYWRKKRRK